MTVHKPKNVDDEDIGDGKEVVSKPMDEPTCMSYFLERVRFSEIFLASLERSPFAALSPDAISFQHVQELETQITRFWDDTPSFLRFNPALSVKITIQGYILNFFVHGQRCRIHLPYLARGAANPSYATSRADCVESARFIIRMEQRLEKEESDFASTRLRMSIVLHHIFPAFLVLLLDIYIEPSKPRQLRKDPEAAAVWRILQDAKAQSQQASVLVEPLDRVMLRYHVSHSVDEMERQVPEALAPAAISPFAFSAPERWALIRDSLQIFQGWNNLGIDLELFDNN